MATSSLVTQRIRTSQEREAIFRIRHQDRVKLEKHLFKRYPDREWGTFFKFGFRRTSWGITITFIDSILPTHGDLCRTSSIVEFAAGYNLRAFRTGRNEEVAIGVVHSHPAGFNTGPSELDDDMDAYFATELTHFANGLPYCSLIFQRCDDIGFTFTGRIYDRGEWMPVKTMFTVGDRIDKCSAENFPVIVEREVALGGESTTERLRSLFGNSSVKRLRQATVGIIGNSGTGTPVGHALARAGVGGFVVVDPQRISPSNHERMHSTFYDDLSSDSMPYKAALLKRLIRAVNPNASVVAYVGDLMQENVLDDLLRCDIILGCTDSIYSRVFLSDLAKHHLMPSLDVAVAMDGQQGMLTSQVVQFTRYSPDSPCAFCYDLVDASEMAAELMSEKERESRRAAAQAAEEPDAYWRQSQQVHTVGCMTSTAGAMASGYAIGWLTNAFSMPHDSFQFDIGKPKLGVVEVRSQTSTCSCSLKVGWGDLARSFRNVARPGHWRKRAIRL